MGNAKNGLLLASSTAVMCRGEGGAREVIAGAAKWAQGDIKTVHSLFATILYTNKVLQRKS